MDFMFISLNEKCRYHIFIHVHALTVCAQSICWFSTIVVMIIKWIKSLEVIFSFYLFSSLCTNKFLCYSLFISLITCTCIIIRNPECGSLYSTLIYNVLSHILLISGFRYNNTVYTECYWLTVSTKELYLLK